MLIICRFPEEDLVRLFSYYTIYFLETHADLGDVLGANMKIGFLSFFVGSESCFQAFDSIKSFGASVLICWRYCTSSEGSFPTTM